MTEPVVRIFCWHRNFYKSKQSNGERRKKRKDKWRNEEMLLENYNINTMNYNSKEKQKFDEKQKPQMELQNKGEKATSFNWWCTNNH